MAERVVRYGWVWVVFIAVMMLGSALVLSRRPALRALGLAVLLLPIAAFGLLQAVFYVRSRRMARDEAGPPEPPLT